MYDLNAPRRPAWLDVALALGVGVLGGLIAIVAFSNAPEAFAAIAGLLAPGIVGGIAGLIIRRGQAVVPLVVGIVVAPSLATLLDSASAPDLVQTALAAGASALGFAAAFGARSASEVQMGPFRPPSPVERERLTREITQQVRSIDPAAPGSFERAMALLRQVNEQLQTFGMYGPWHPGAPDSTMHVPSDLVEVQAELVEAARMSALAAGARRVTITGAGSSVDVQAIFGDPIVGAAEAEPGNPGDPPWPMA